MRGCCLSGDWGDEMRYPYGTIVCIVAVGVNAFFAGIDVAHADRTSLTRHISLVSVPLFIAVYLSIRDWRFKERIFKAYVEERRAKDAQV